MNDTTEEIYISIRGAYDAPGQQLPLLFVWIGNDLIDFFVCGVRVKRIDWLPAWFPLNVKWDCSPDAQIKATAKARTFAQRLIATKGGAA